MPETTCLVQDVDFEGQVGHKHHCVRRILDVKGRFRPDRPVWLEVPCALFIRIDARQRVPCRSALCVFMTRTNVELRTSYIEWPTIDGERLRKAQNSVLGHGVWRCLRPRGVSGDGTVVDDPASVSADHAGVGSTKA